MPPSRLWFASLLLATACSSAHADRVAAVPPSRVALALAPAPVRAPYDVQILGESGETLPTYGHRGRFYVQGDRDERYIIRISNPTPRRIEAVVSVDGLDVIDGENGDLRKRGYVVPPYGETRIEGFRTSRADVATFRFSSVGGSYAGLKGKARNVGVIAVALFEEREVAPPVIVGGTYPRPPRPYPYGSPRTRDAEPATEGAAHGAPRASADKAAPSRPAAPPAAGVYAPADDLAEARRYDAPAQERLGLGTEFGEQRYSAVSFTQFVRAPGRPVAIAELRYNDAAGLVALGIPVAPLPDPDEVMMRETADPFPGDRFARAPR